MKLRSLLIPVGAAALLMLAGCNTVQNRISHNQTAFEHATPMQQELIRQGKVGLGFDPELVKLALGEPDIIRTRTEESGSSIIWIYTEWDHRDDPFWYNDFGWYGPYHHRWHGGFYALHAPFPYSYRHDQELVRVVFKDGKVVSIEQEP